MNHPFDETYWDDVWSGGSGAAMSTAPPHPSLVEEVGALEPGNALEAGCGAGAEAIWLAGRGWQVTGVDLTRSALEAAAGRAEAAGVSDRVTWVRADLATWEPDGRFDLVTTHYAHAAVPQLDLYERLASWVAPGGTLLVVGHRGGHGHGQGHAHGPEHGGPPHEASVRAADVTARLDPAAWEVVTAQEVERAIGGPDGHARTLHDVVVRARRRSG